MYDDTVTSISYALGCRKPPLHSYEIFLNKNSKSGQADEGGVWKQRYIHTTCIQTENLVTCMRRGSNEPSSPKIITVTIASMDQTIVLMSNVAKDRFQYSSLLKTRQRELQKFICISYHIHTDRPTLLRYSPEFLVAA